MRRITRLCGGVIAALALASCGAPNTDAMLTFAAGPSGLASFFDCVEDEGGVFVSAHRGRAGDDPENSIASMAAVLTQAPAIMEVDVRSTKDGALVLLHDKTLDRETTCEGPLEDVTLAEFKQCRLRDGQRRETDLQPDTLSEALAWARGRTVLQLDVKEARDFDDVVAAVRSAGARQRVIIITYTGGATERVARLDREILISTPIDSQRDLDRLISAGVDPQRLIAWTGTRPPSNRVLNDMDEAGVPAINGVLGDRNEPVNAGRHQTLEERGVDIFATDRAPAVHRALDPEASLAAIKACSG